MVLNGATVAGTFEPKAYRRWFSTPLGRRVDADEKRAVFELAELKPGERVLDIGCGDGNYTGPAAEHTGAAVGLDRDRAMLAAAAARLRDVRGLRWIEGDATRLPFSDASFDAVLAITVLCFVADRHAVIVEAHRVLRPGGRLVIGELGRYSWWALERRVRGYAGHPTWRAAHFFSPRELHALLDAAGFVDIAHRAAVFYPPITSLARSRFADVIERVGRRVLPSTGAFLALRGHRSPLLPRR